MIIPTPEFDPFFTPGPPLFRDRMLAYIQQQFPELATADLLDSITSPGAAAETSVESTITVEETTRRVA